MKDLRCIMKVGLKEEPCVEISLMKDNEDICEDILTLPLVLISNAENMHAKDKGLKRMEVFSFTM